MGASIKPIIRIMSLQCCHVHSVLSGADKVFFNYLVTEKRRGKNKITAASLESHRSGLRGQHICPDWDEGVKSARRAAMDQTKIRLL